MPDVADLVFASEQANHNFAHILGDLRRSRLSISHRLRSIRRDASFVAAVAARVPGLPLVVNERAGAWYVPTQAPVPDNDVGVDAIGRRRPTAASAYFKSTDGHTGQWSFSTRRLNLHLLPLLGEHGGIVLVDSTRRGKRMPDALSKTVPLWCCVVNEVLFGESDAAAAAAAALFTPASVVSPSEHSQMLARVPVFADALRRLGVLDDRAAWRTRLRNKPLRPVWVVPDDSTADWQTHVDALLAQSECNVVVCCTASACTALDDADHATYIQGAADDTENWAHGLTPAVFWAHCDLLLNTPEADLPATISDLVAAAINADHGQDPSEAMADCCCSPVARDLTLVAPRLAVGLWVRDPADQHAGEPCKTQDKPACIRHCQVVFVRQPQASLPSPAVASASASSPSVLTVALGTQDKIAGRNLRHALPAICDFVHRALAGSDGGDGGDGGDCSAPKTVRVLCETGRDVSVGAALAMLCECFDETGQPLVHDGPQRPASQVFNKDAIRARLARIMAAMPQANPSRATLQSVNSYLMESRR